MKQLKPRIKRTLRTETSKKTTTGTKRIRGGKWEKIRNYVLSKEPLCRVCNSGGITTVAVEVDHIIPLHKKGTNEINNLQPLCWQCHYDKSQRERREWYRRQGG